TQSKGAAGGGRLSSGERARATDAPSLNLTPKPVVYKGAEVVARRSYSAGRLCLQVRTAMKSLLVLLFLCPVVYQCRAEGPKSASAPPQGTSASFRQQPQQSPTQFAGYPLNSVYGLTYQGSYPQLASYLQRPNGRPSLGSRLRNFMNSLFFRRNQQAGGFYSPLPVFSYKPPANKPDLVQSKPVLYSSSTANHKMHFPGFQGTKNYKDTLTAASSYALPHAYLSGYTGKVYNNLYGTNGSHLKSYGSKGYNTGFKA
ncbi:unnamed protein product, partial [Ixodes pacificus]